MTALVFALIMALSIGVAILARVGVRRMDIKQFLVAGRSFPPFLLFFLAVGEVYSIGTMLGFPGGIYGGGASYGLWFLGYILLAYPIGYFLAPLVWRAAKRYDALTVPEVFGRHFGSRKFELVIAIGSIIALVPWGQFQFIGLEVVLQGLGVPISPIGAVLIAASIAFLYIAIAGVRGSAFVAFVKDAFMLLGIVVVGVAAVMSAHGISPLFAHATAAAPTHVHMGGVALTFAMTTIVYQGFGFYLQPSVSPYVFPAKSEAAVKSSTVFMPMYMLMYPFAVFAAFFAVSALPNTKNPNGVFLNIAHDLLPPWLVGVVAAGAGLAGIMVLASTSLNIGAIVTRNLVPNVPAHSQRRWTVLAVAIFLVAAAAMTTFTPALMLTVLNLSGYVGIQFATGWIAIFFARKVHAFAAGTGIVTGVLLALALYATSPQLGGINIGLIALGVNLALTFGLSHLAPGRTPQAPIATSEPAPSVSVPNRPDLPVTNA
ncbi:sodium:solute symporter family protein [Leekyejoonella antrihumi]|uniref:Sodium:solute symporter family protein n=1 Tax=Leekyejoonella antrihumi TaxID=1660198 RepID=A0A563DYG4_9MICO|nr:sodium:solute symporter family protein [Leekyejoonella antrihumi]TWP35159.1 sodium:solute symporter family protein [Leekyejoonella antrihumi]